MLDLPRRTRPASNVRTLAAVKPPFVRQLEWQIDHELERSEPWLTEPWELLDSDRER
jgi:hypothetical protein